jgi:transcriptional regulator with XRE-family HTH domain
VHLKGGAVMPISRKTYTKEENQFLKNIGFKIQFLRKKAGMSQHDLAEKADLSYATISHLESTSVYGLSIVAVHRIANALGVEPDQLMKFD